MTIYLAVAQLKFPHLAPAIAVLALDALTMLFWFAGFIALAVYHSNLGECRGRVCDDLVAAIVFGAFNWYVFPFAMLRVAERIYRQMLSGGQSMSFSQDVHILTHQRSAGSSSPPPLSSALSPSSAATQANQPPLQRAASR